MRKLPRQEGWIQLVTWHPLFVAHGWLVLFAIGDQEKVEGSIFLLSQCQTDVNHSTDLVSICVPPHVVLDVALELGFHGYQRAGAADQGIELRRAFQYPGSAVSGLTTQYSLAVFGQIGPHLGEALGILPGADAIRDARLVSVL